MNIDIKFYTHLLKMDYESYENPNVQIKKDRSKNTLSLVWNVCDILFGLISQSISIICSILVLSFFNPIIIFVTVIFSIINYFIKIYINKQLFKLDQEGSNLDRKKWGIVYMIEQEEYGMEARIFNLKDLFISEYSKIETDEINLNLKYFKKQNIIPNVTQLFSFIENIMIYFYLIIKVVNKIILIGNFTIILSYFHNFKNSLNNLLGSFVELSTLSLNVDELNEFLNIPTHIYSSGTDEIKTNEEYIIEFRNVSFKYPSSDKYALKGINLKIKKGQKVCIVGTNGSGKSTFIKLLMRLYTPTEGEILLNQKNINSYSYEEYINLFSPVFQDFVKYYLDLGINITLSNNYDIDKLNLVTKKCDLSSLIDSLPKQYKTQICKWIDPEGIEPSGGEEQKIAIARAIYNNREIFILDEPTASLDPNAEYELYLRFNTLIENKTALLITHRLSAVHLADYIAVFDDGKIIEYGTHQELYNLNGKYKDLFNKQASFYKDLD